MIRWAAYILFATAITVQAQETLGNKLPDVLFEEWIKHAMPLKPHVQQMRDARVISATIPVEYDDYCAWQPIRGVLVLKEHIECPRLVDAMENK